MSSLDILILTVLIFTIAILYSTVGHAGATGYLAAMALLGVSPAVMKPTALVLNILVASVASHKFYQARCFSWGLFWPFAVTSIPFAYLGGAMRIADETYKLILGISLLYAAIRLAFAPPARTQPVVPPKRWIALLMGAVIGLVSGLIGIGGGVFLSPIILLAGWGEPRTTSAVAAVFILVNSISGLIGNLASTAYIPAPIPFWAVAALAGGWIGSGLGSRRLGGTTIRRLLAVVVFVAGLKMIVG